MQSNSTSPLTNAKVSRIAEPRVHAEQPAPILPIYIIMYGCTILLRPSSRIAGSDIFVSGGEATAMESQYPIVKPDVCSSLLRPTLYPSWL